MEKGKIKLKIVLPEKNISANNFYITRILMIKFWKIKFQ